MRTQRTRGSVTSLRPQVVIPSAPELSDSYARLDGSEVSFGLPKGKLSAIYSNLSKACVLFGNLSSREHFSRVISTLSLDVLPSKRTCFCQVSTFFVLYSVPTYRFSVAGPSHGRTKIVYPTSIDHSLAILSCSLNSTMTWCLKFPMVNS
jgi:hypothetical protein